ncbi:MAG TPA: hypothetical protein PK916_15350 [Bacteroidota bacterium]|jgi:hypothetical protein|nr:hypothetical protein [Bacteroidota bacterium]
MRKPDKSLAEKWGIMPWLKIRIDNDPAWLRELVEPLCEDTKMARQGVCDIAFVAPTSAAEWKQKARRLKLAIDPDGVIWVVYPKDDFREKYQFDGSLAEMVQIVKEFGLKHTKLAAVNDELTSVRFSL